MFFCPAVPVFSFNAVPRYAATEDNELSFNEGDIIISVQTISEDWWQGSLADGSSVGLFPGARSTNVANISYIYFLLPHTKQHMLHFNLHQLHSDFISMSF